MYVLLYYCMCVLSHISLSFSLCIYMLLCMSLCLSLSTCVIVCIFLYVCIIVCVYLSLSLCVLLCICEGLSLCPPIYTSLCVGDIGIVPFYVCKICMCNAFLYGMGCIFLHTSFFMCMYHISLYAFLFMRIFFMRLLPPPCARVLYPSMYNRECFSQYVHI